MAKADWAGDHCEFGTDTPLSSWTKSQAKAYANVAVGDGYHWGGGCWLWDNVDATPNETPEQEFPRGEGADCSGLTLRSWALPKTFGAGGKRYYPYLDYEHGQYVAASFHSAPGGTTPFLNIAKSTASNMDAFASTTHIGMIYTPNTSQGQDLIVEAKSEAIGTVKAIRNYRGDGAYTGVRRKNWG